MTPKSISDQCEKLGFTVRRVPATGIHRYEATSRTARSTIYWSTSTLGGLLGLPRVLRANGMDTHCRTLAEIKFSAESLGGVTTHV